MFRPYNFAKELKKALQEEKEVIDVCIDAMSNKIVFISSGKENDNWAIKDITKAGSDVIYVIMYYAERHAVFHSSFPFEKTVYNKRFSDLVEKK